MKISENDNTITATETLKFKDFSLKEQEQFLDMIYEDGLTLEEAKEKIGKLIEDVLITRFEPQNNIFPEMYINKELKLQTDWKSKAIKYQKFYEYIKHLLRNANLEENIVREKIREMEKGIENED
jgi:hypothetical protein